MDLKERRKAGQKAAGLGIGINIVLFIFKLAAGLAFNSIAVVADAVNNLSDTGTSFITLFGFKMSGKPADRKHPFGHARMEYIAALSVSFVIIFAGIQLFISAVQKIVSPDNITFSYLTVAVLAGSVLIKFVLWMYYLRLGKKIKSPTLTAVSHDSRNDVLSTLAILISLFIFRLTGFDLDGYAGAGISIMILYFGARLIMETSNPLIGTAPSKKLVDKVNKKIRSYDGIIGLHDLVVHNYGYKKTFASVHCEVPAEKDIMESHGVVDRIERDIMEEMGINLVIHIDPVSIEDEETKQARREVDIAAKKISHKINVHDFRVVRGKERTKMIFDIAVPFNFEYNDTEISDMVSDKVCEGKPHCICVINVDHY